MKAKSFVPVLALVLVSSSLLLQTGMSRHRDQYDEEAREQERAEKAARKGEKTERGNPKRGRTDREHVAAIRGGRNGRMENRYRRGSFRQTHDPQEKFFLCCCIFFITDNKK